MDIFIWLYTKPAKDDNTEGEAYHPLSVIFLIEDNGEITG
jgi:hypothetical protein